MEPKTVSLDLSRLAAYGAVTLIADGDGGNLSFREQAIELTPSHPVVVELKPRGGFVIVSKRSDR